LLDGKIVARGGVTANHPRRVKRRAGGAATIDRSMSDRLTWLGHATVLLELGGARLVTDPILRPRVAHLLREVPVPGDVGRLDAILVSHGHHDHLDLPSLRRLDRTAPVVAPPDAAWALRLAGHPTRTVVPGDELELAGVRVRAVPAAHDGRRVPVGQAPSAVGFVAAGVYFAGDTEPYPEMAALAGTLDVALLPVAGWGPKVGPGHMDPRGAAEALALLRPGVAVPIHWGTYRRVGHRGTGEPAQEFAAHAAELAPDVRIVVLAPGGSVEITRAV
jgi:L-ascorbate metabolism protein UlaG (beta-lactamase superfamily)